MPIDSLPIELVDLILENASLDQAALKSCSLIHRSWVAPSRKYIFAELFVGREKGFGGTKSKCKRLLDILQASPHLASYFCRVNIMVHPDSDESSTRKAKLLSKILLKLNHVRSLVLRSSDHQYLPYTHLRPYLREAISKLVSNPTFESFTLHYWIFADDASNFVELIKHCSKTLKYLALSGLHFAALKDRCNDRIDLPLELPNLQEYRIRTASSFVHKQLFTFPKLENIHWPMHMEEEEGECASVYTLAGTSQPLAHWSFHVGCDGNLLHKSNLFSRLAHTNHSTLDMLEGLLCRSLPRHTISSIKHLGLFLETGYSTNLTIAALRYLNDVLPPSSKSQIESIIVTFLLGCEPYRTWDEGQWQQVIYSLLPPILIDHHPDGDFAEMQRSVTFIFKVSTWTTPKEPSPEVAAMIEEYGDSYGPSYTDVQKYGNGAYRVQKILQYAQDILEDKFEGHLAGRSVSFTTLYSHEAWIF
ncbi:hypothetical protein ONZ45_g5398 [Pleurotus djamor]|nr:hypothetical protein ONZ45_g5398 [Pleurotus djamor]